MNKYCKIPITMYSEGGTSEELRTDPHLKFSSVVHKVVKNPHLDKIRSALTLFLSGAKISVENYVGQTWIVGLLSKFFVK